MAADRLVRNMSRHAHPVSDAVPRQLGVERAVLRRVADQQEVCVAAVRDQRGERVDDRRNPLFGGHLPERREHDTAVNAVDAVR